MNIVFFGTPPFAAKILDFLFKHHQKIVAVVTRVDKPRGRTKELQPSAVKEYLLQTHPNIPLLQPIKASTEEFVQTIKIFQPDLFVVVAYGEIIKKNLLDLPQKGCINVHASLLPKYRGAAPMQRCLMNGDKETGISIIEMALEMDAGPILGMEKIFLDEEINLGQLQEKLCDLSGPLLLNVIKKIEQGNIQKNFQNPSEVTFAPKITPEDRVIHWHDTAWRLHNRIRALSPIPGAFCLVRIDNEIKRMLIKKSFPLPDQHPTAGKTISYHAKEWVISCGKGSLALREVQLEGKKNLSIDTFVRGMSVPPEIISN